MSIAFDQVADIYDETRALHSDIMSQLMQAIVQMSRATPNTHFFEPGIGTGRIALPLLEQGYTYTGLDISEPMMEKLRQKAQGIAGSLILINGDVTALPFPNDTFDVAIAAHLLHLVPDWQTALEEMYRVLKPGGIIIYLHHSRAETAIGNQWSTILTRYGHNMTSVSGETEDVLADWRERNIPFETQLIAMDIRQHTIANYLQAYRDRIYSNLWRIPDDVFHQALLELAAWIADTYPDPNVTIESSSPISISAATVTAE